MSETPAVVVDDLGFRYPGRPSRVLHDVGFTVAGAEWVGILGPNGSGKTTLLRLLLGQLQPESGEVRVLGGPPVRTRKNVGYVPQHAGIDPSVPASVLDIALLGRLSSSSWGPWYPADDREIALSALEETGTADLAALPWRSLSGGQRQRVLIARALASRAQLLLLDEPTAGIDIHREKTLLRLLERLSEHLPIIMVTHDMALVSHHMHRALWVDGDLREIEAGSLDPDSLERFFHRGRT
ncbi:MAG: ATP-binding cassette domain-containing protein [Thermoanaerobaculales bacterium]|jgi:zinc transport system ATP-binding protein|nr:ATP-binding cassette domain-containing protein [Thermoanaerobaculales bacterium]